VLAQRFVENLQPLFSSVGLGQVEMGEVGGQGRTQDERRPFPAHLQGLSGAEKAIGALAPPNMQRRGSLFGQLIGDNLVKSGASQEQALSIFGALLPPSFGELVAKISTGDGLKALLGGTNLSDEGDQETTRKVKGELRQALTGASRVYELTGRPGATPGQIDEMVELAQITHVADRERRDAASVVRRAQKQAVKDKESRLEDD